MSKEDMRPIMGKVCISSVCNKEEGFRDYRYIASLAAEELGYISIRNPENDGCTQSDFEYTLTQEYPIVILIVGTEDSDMVRREFSIAFEKCLPVFIFIKTNGHTIEKKTEEFIKSISPVSYSYDCTTFETCEQLYKHVKTALSKYLQRKNREYPILQPGKGAAYTENTRLMSHVRKQLIICQQTSILILGPRKNVEYECKFYITLLDWLKNKNESIEFLHVFSVEATKEELKKNPRAYDLATARENLEDLFKLYQNKSHGFSFSFNIMASQNKENLSYVISDTNIIFLVPVEGQYFTINLPKQLMRNAEIETIKFALSRNAKPLALSDLGEVYSFE